MLFGSAIQCLGRHRSYKVGVRSQWSVQLSQYLFYFGILGSSCFSTKLPDALVKGGRNFHALATLILHSTACNRDVLVVGLKRFPDARKFIFTLFYFWRGLF